MKTIREELIEVRNKIDELINLLGTETEVTPTPEEPLENIIFNTRLFDTPEKLEQLKRIIGSFICENPAKEERKIVARTKNQYFYLYAALWSMPNVLTDDSMANFIRQMIAWFPEWFSSDKKELRNYERSLSHEKKKWEQKGELLEVKDWKPFMRQCGMSVKKAMYVESLAMKIYTDINLLVKNILKEKH